MSQGLDDARFDVEERQFVPSWLLPGALSKGQARTRALSQREHGVLQGCVHLQGIQ